MPKKQAITAAMREFVSAQVMTLSQLESLLGCSQRSVQRQLAIWGALRSYNCNGKYFSLPAVAQFDSFGIWRFQDIAFSRFGTLRDTVAHLVRNSPSGLTIHELSELLSVNAYSFMSQFRNDSRLKREKWTGRLVYFCSEHDILIAQRRERSKTQPPPPLPSDAQSVVILVTLLKHPNASLEEIVRTISLDYKGIDISMVERLLEFHGLEKKTLLPPCS